jgi:amino-acid N-acetyltransferase
MSPVLRPAAPGDWPAIAALLSQHGLPTEGAADHLAHFIVAEEAGGIAGVAGLELYGDAALLRSVAVAEPGAGLGSVLVRAAITQARASGVHDVILLTTTAARFFPRFGFERIGREAVPAALLASSEFRGACPASAETMALRIVASN